MIWTYVAAALIAALAAAGGTWRVQDWRYAAKERDRMEQEAKEQGIRVQRIDMAAAGHEADKAAIRTEFITITERVEHVVQEPFYAAGAAACLDADGLRELSAATRGVTAAGEPAPTVPRPAASR